MSDRIHNAIGLARKMESSGRMVLISRDLSSDREMICLWRGSMIDSKYNTRTVYNNPINLLDYRECEVEYNPDPDKVYNNVYVIDVMYGKMELATEYDRISGKYTLGDGEYHSTDYVYPITDRAFYDVVEESTEESNLQLDPHSFLEVMLQLRDEGYTNIDIEDNYILVSSIDSEDVYEIKYNELEECINFGLHRIPAYAAHREKKQLHEELAEITVRTQAIKQRLEELNG